MDTLYIDVYFFLNFTIDVLAAFFACKLLRIRASLAPLVAIGALGGISAIVECFIEGLSFSLLNTLTFLLISMFLIKRGISMKKRFGFILAFFATSMMLGGAISFFYDFIDRNLSDVLDGLTGTGANRTALIFSLVVLISIGVLRIIIMLFSGNASGEYARIKVEIEGESVEFDALVDSGNLVKDPLSMCPVIFIKRPLALSFLPGAIVDLNGVDSLPFSYKKRIRLIPVTRGGETHVMVGLRVDKVLLVQKGKKDEVDATIVIDKDEGDFGGHLALTPSVILE